MPTTIKTLLIAIAIATTIITLIAATITIATAAPTSAHPYNDTQELQTVINTIKHERSPENIDFFHKTNLDVTTPFIDVIAPPSPSPSHQTKHPFLRILLYVIANNPFLHATSLFLKFYYNRTRPYKQFPQHIVPLSTTTADQTPSYPSSHALQAFAIAKHLTKLYPQYSSEITRVANRIARARVIGGVHYHTDVEFAHHLANQLPWI